jgi:hypothetical protein
MIVHVVRTSAIVGACALLLGMGQAAQQRVALVTVIATADGPITDLTAKDFIVREGSNRREAAAAELATDPLSVVLLVDSAQPPMGVTPPTQDLRTAVSAFVTTLQTASPSAQIALGQFAGAAVTSVEFTTETQSLEKGIQRLVPDLTATAVMLEALVDAGKKLADAPAPRRSIVTIDYNSPETSADRTMKQAAESITKAGATLWAVSIRGTGSVSSFREETLNKVSKASGGTRLYSATSTALASQMKIIAHSLLSQYTVTFASSGGDPKSISMETKRGAKVQLSPWMR